jgi:hypothetical protein
VQPRLLLVEGGRGREVGLAGGVGARLLAVSSPVEPQAPMQGPLVVL